MYGAYMEYIKQEDTVMEGIYFVSIGNNFIVAWSE